MECVMIVNERSKGACVTVQVRRVRDSCVLLVLVLSLGACSSTRLALVSSGAGTGGPAFVECKVEIGKTTKAEFDASCHPRPPLSGHTIEHGNCSSYSQINDEKGPVLVCFQDGILSAVKNNYLDSQQMTGIPRLY